MFAAPGRRCATVSVKHARPAARPPPAMLVSLRLPLRSFAVALAVASFAVAAALPAGPAPLFPDLGRYHLPADTRKPLAQRYADQGMVLAFGFNPAEAARSFAAATALDPDAPRAGGPRLVARTQHQRRHGRRRTRRASSRRRRRGRAAKAPRRAARPDRRTFRPSPAPAGPRRGRLRRAHARAPEAPPDDAEVRSSRRSRS